MSLTLFPKSLQRVFEMFSVKDSSSHSILLHAYEAGKKDAEGHSNQVPVLLGGTPHIEVLDWPKLISKDSDSVTFTGPEADFLKVILSDLATQMQHSQKDLREAEQAYYSMSDKETVHGPYFFKKLNRIRNEMRIRKAHMKKIDNLIRKIKAR